MSDNEILTAISEGRTSWIYKLDKQTLVKWIRRLTGIERRAEQLSIEVLQNELREIVTAGIEETNDTEQQVGDVADRDMASFLNSLEAFDRKKDDIEEFLERLNLYLIAANISENKQKAAILVTKLGAETYSAIRAECRARDDLTKKTYEQLIQILKEKIFPPKNHLNERSRFRKIKQALTQDIREFAAHIRREAVKCKFASEDEACLDQFINGLATEQTRFEVLKAKSKTFEKARTTAIDTEHARANAKGEEQEENKESKLWKMSNTNRQTFQRRGTRGRDDRRGGGPRAGNTAGRGKTVGPNSCYCCGRRGHFARECHFNATNCEGCGKRGHMIQVCRDKPSTSEARQQHWMLNEGQQRADSESEEDDVDERADGAFRKVHMIKAEPNCRESTLRMKVVERMLEVEVDTGAYYTVMPEKEKQKLFPNREIEKTDVFMRFYDHEPMGKSSKIKIELDSDVRHLDIYVTKEGCGLLMGR